MISTKHVRERVIFCSSYKESLFWMSPWSFLWSTHTRNRNELSKSLSEPLALNAVTFCQSFFPIKPQWKACVCALTAETVPTQINEVKNCYYPPQNEAVRKHYCRYGSSSPLSRNWNNWQKNSLTPTPVSHTTGIYHISCSVSHPPACPSLRPTCSGGREGSTQHVKGGKVGGSFVCRTKEIIFKAAILGSYFKRKKKTGKNTG